ncbi:MAG: Arc family DNA-binding protein [Pseudomonadota bacterium]
MPPDPRDSNTADAEATHKFVVRLPMPLRNRIAQAAKYFRRSMNSEIIARLEQSFQGIPSQAVSDDLAPQMHESMQNVFAAELTEEEELVLRGYRRMPEDKRRALVDLLS